MTTHSASDPGTALITGASRGLGRALAAALARDGWRLVIDARDPGNLHSAAAELREQGAAAVVALAGDVADLDHLDALAAATGTLLGGEARLDAVVLNASVLGAAPMRPLLAHADTQLAEVFAVNVVAPLQLLRRLQPLLADEARVVGISSDAAVEAYPTWGGYGASKAALDHALAVLAVERPGWRVLAVDPGDLRTELHLAAVPDADPTTLTPPETVVPALLRLLRGEVPSGRHRAAELVEVAS